MATALFRAGESASLGAALMTAVSKGMKVPTFASEEALAAASAAVVVEPWSKMSARRTDILAQLAIGHSCEDTFTMAVVKVSPAAAGNKFVKPGACSVGHPLDRGEPVDVAAKGWAADGTLVRADLPGFEAAAIAAYPGIDPELAIVVAVTAMIVRFGYPAGKFLADNKTGIRLTTSVPADPTDLVAVIPDPQGLGHDRYISYQP